MKTRERLVNNHTAKLLHELGFKGEKQSTVVITWSQDKDSLTKEDYQPSCFLNENYFKHEYEKEDFKSVFKDCGKYLEIQFPTLSATQKWLRDSYNVYIEIKKNIDGYSSFTYPNYELDGKFWLNYICEMSDDNLRKNHLFETYEDAQEDGIYKALEEIKNGKII